MCPFLNVDTSKIRDGLSIFEEMELGKYFQKIVHSKRKLRIIFAK